MQPAKTTIFLVYPHGLWIAIALGLLLKLALLVTGSVTFNGDEAVLSLMAKHILNGERPSFFYGQAYMGALDAYLRAFFFLVFGQNVLAGRLLQISLFAGVIATTYLLTLRLSNSSIDAFAAAALIAVPPVLFSLYTTAGIGDYVEVLFLNNLLWWLGWEFIAGRKDSWKWWLLAGLIGGVGWWSMSLIAISIIPLLAIGLWQRRRDLPIRRISVAGLGFAVGAAPWWIAVVTGPTVVQDLMGARVAAIPTNGLGVIGQRLVSLILFNLTALVGLRPPWSLDWIAPPIGIFVAVLCLFILWYNTRWVTNRNEPPDSRAARATLLGAWALVIAVFIFTRFGNDPTGRYLTHLYPPLVILAGVWLSDLRRAARRHRDMPVRFAVAAFGVILAFNLWGNVRSMLHNPPGLTTQFDPISHLPQDRDDDLIEFLDSMGGDRGYSNYWVAMRLAFLTDERIVFSSRLPYKADMSYTYLDERYPLYAEAVSEARHVVYVTSNHPELDRVLRTLFDAHGITYREKHLEPYTIFFDLSRPASPEELNAPWLSEASR